MPALDRIDGKNDVEAEIMKERITGAIGMVLGWKRSGGRHRCKRREARTVSIRPRFSMSSVAPTFAGVSFVNLCPYVAILLSAFPCLSRWAIEIP